MWARFSHQSSVHCPSVVPSILQSPKMLVEKGVLWFETVEGSQIPDTKHWLDVLGEVNVMNQLWKRGEAKAGVAAKVRRTRLKGTIVTRSSSASDRNTKWRPRIWPRIVLTPVFTLVNNPVNNQGKKRSTQQGQGRAFTITLLLDQWMFNTIVKYWNTIHTGHHSYAMLLYSSFEWLYFKNFLTPGLLSKAQDF